MKINTGLLEEAPTGIVYILYLDIEYEGVVYKVTKIGVTTRAIEARVTEILTSIWKKTRVFPRCYVKRFTTVKTPYKMESHLLSLCLEPLDIGIKFSGSTECFILDDEYRESILTSYEVLIDAYYKNR